MVVVIATLSILVLAVAPSDNLSNIYVEGATQRLEQDLRYARELAVTKNINCGVEIQTNGDYSIYEGTPATKSLNPLTQQPFNYNLGNNFPDVNILNIASTLLVEFNPMGTPVSGSGTPLQVGNALKTISLTVTANTGVVQRL